MANHQTLTPEWLNKNYLEYIVQNCINKNQKIINVEVTPGSNVGDNYMCQILRIKLILENEEIFLIGKHNVDTPMDQEIIAKENYYVHKVESKFLSKALPILNKRTLGRRIGPKVYHSDDDKRIIFMEDLKQQGFKIVPRESFLDIYHCFKTIQAYATLHAASYLELKENPEIKVGFQNNIWRKDLPDFLCKFVNNSIQGIEEKMDLWNFSDQHRQIFQNVKQRIADGGFEKFEFNPKYFNVLTHGDCWKNNMMFRYENDEVKEVCLLDFQGVNYTCFAIDLQYFLSSSAQRRVRYDQTNTLLEYYYNEFCKVAPNVPELSLARVLKEFEETNFVGLIYSLLMRSLVVSKDGVDLDGILNGKSDTGSYNNQDMREEVIESLEYFQTCI